jgi:hypothetical protein
VVSAGEKPSKAQTLLKESPPLNSLGGGPNSVVPTLGRGPTQDSKLLKGDLTLTLGKGPNMRLWTPQKGPSFDSLGGGQLRGPN